MYGGERLPGCGLALTVNKEDRRNSEMSENRFGKRSQKPKTGEKSQYLLV